MDGTHVSYDFCAAGRCSSIKKTRNCDTGKDTEAPETGDGMTVTVWAMAATLSVAAVLALSAKKRED